MDAFLSSLFVRGLDEQRQRLRPADDVAADDGDGAKLADGARVREHHPVQKAPVFFYFVSKAPRKRKRDK